MGKYSNMVGYLGLICGILSILPSLIFIISVTIGALGSIYFGITIGIAGIALSRLNIEDQVSEAGLIASIIGISLNTIIFVMFVGIFN